MGKQNNLDAVTAVYREVRPQYERFTAKLKSLLHELLEASGVEVHAIESRTKTVESLTEKVTRDGKSYTNPLGEISDLTGLRIILYYQDDVDRVSSLLDREFQIDSTRSVDKRATLETDQFGYLSVHKIISLSEPRSTLAEWKGLHSMVAEIQIRTVLQHAWAAIQHKLEYKTALDVPREFRRRLIRLSGLLELADEEFSVLRREQGDLVSTIKHQVTRGELDISIDALALRAFLPGSRQVKRLLAAAQTAGVEITGQRRAEVSSTEPLPSDSDISQLVNVCAAVGLSTIGQLEELLALVDTIDAAKIFSKVRQMQELENIRRLLGTSAHWIAVIVAAVRAERMPAREGATVAGWASDYQIAIETAAESVFGSNSPEANNGAPNSGLAADA